MSKLQTSIAAIIALASVSACGTTQAAQPSQLFEAGWNSGQNASEPAFQAQYIDADTIVIRQSIRTTFEAPFLYLLFGEDKALLIDTGVEGADLRSEVDAHIAKWLDANGKTDIQLVIMHTHGHGDHIGGDSSFSDRPDTITVGHTAEDAANYFGIENWPIGTGSINLGDRTLEVLPTPGHHDSHVMVFDPKTHILFSGDTIYPGRLYFQCGKASLFQSSIERAATFAASRDVRWVLGAHIEMTTKPGKAFQGQNKVRKGEHVLELPVSIIEDIQSALNDQNGQFRVTNFDDFVLFPHPADPTGMSPPDWCLSDASTY
jgi:glyoxylase-like metal-dependent hydrolase (beta-lactamase superfamily II)